MEMACLAAIVMAWMPLKALPETMLSTTLTLVATPVLKEPFVRIPLLLFSSRTRLTKTLAEPDPTCWIRIPAWLEFDPDSVMTGYLPAEVMISGEPVEPRPELSSGDIALIRKIYPGR